MSAGASRIDLLTLRLFVAAVDEQSIAKAAWRENITTSAVSKRISDLEAVLRTSLLIRHRQGVEPTEAGRTLLSHARAILNRIDQLYNDVDDFGAGVRGLIRVSASESAAIGYLPGDIAVFLADFPLVKIDMQIDTSPIVVRRVMENAVDIGIFTGTEPTGELELIPYRQDRLVLVLPKEHPLAATAGAIPFEAVLDYDLIGSEAIGSIETLTLKAASELGRTPRTRIRVSSFDAACRLVQSGLGITIMAEAVAVPLARALETVVMPIADPWAHRQLTVCFRPGSVRPGAVEHFLELLRRRVAKGSAELVTPAVS